jgi:hypothetical protein
MSPRSADPPWCSSVSFGKVASNRDYLIILWRPDPSNLLQELSEHRFCWVPVGSERVVGPPLAMPATAVLP